MTEFLLECDSSEFFTSEFCIDYSLKNANINVEVVDSCMRDSGGTSEDRKNTLLDLEIAAQSRRGVVVLPSVFVNTVALRGVISSYTVFNAICTGFLSGTEPAICLSCIHCQNLTVCVKSGLCDLSQSSRVVSKRFLGLTIFLICVVFGLVSYLHWMKIREEMRDQVRGILAEYMPLDGGEIAENVSSVMDFAKNSGSTALNA